MELLDGHYCFLVTETMYVEGKGYRPSIVIEGEPGHYPNGGGDVEPWYWGHDIETARGCCDKKNAAMGLAREDVDRIIASSMRSDAAEPVAPGDGQHTPGRLTVEPKQWDQGRTIALCIAGQGIVAEIPPAEECPADATWETAIRQPEDMANAHRLATCWNACIGLDDPEGLRRQRDALLEACQFALDGGIGPAAWDRIRAAIARAEKGPA